MTQSTGLARSSSSLYNAMALPGTVVAKLNYTTHDTAMDSFAVRPEVKSAKAEVLDKISPDILGLKQKDWNQSIDMKRTKYNIKTSDQLLSNSMAPKQLVAGGTQLLSSFSHDPQKVHAFDRGEVTTGWNFSTVTRSKHEATSLLQQLTATAKGRTGKKTATLRRYSSPVQRQAAAMEAQRYRIATAGQADEELEQKWGRETAKEFKYIESLPKPQHRPRIRATQADLDAVKALPLQDTADVDDADDA